MTQKTILTKEQIQQIGLSILPDAMTRGCLIDFARGIEQAVLSSATESRAKNYGDGYQDGWNAAMEEAAIAIDGNDMTSRHAVKTIRTLKRKQS